MDVFANLPKVNAAFAAKADASKPTLVETPEAPLGLVRVEKDESHALGWRVESAGKPEDMPVMNDGDSVIFDFGGHRTGYLSFTLQPYKHGMEPNDAPCRLRIIFGEIVSDVAESFEPYKSWLSKAWLPDEIVTVDYLPQVVKIPRRHAFRFVKFEVIAVSGRFGVKIEDAIATAVSSAPATNPPRLSFTKAGADLSEADKTKLRKIDEVALRTLRNCMQTVYEDGPRRDMRLWLGDVRLQALANYVTFKDTALAKRCLYLFAATPYNEAGLMSASCYEQPYILSGGQSIVDYAELFAPALLDYVEFSGDDETGHELYDLAVKQFGFALARVNEQGIYTGAEKADGSMADVGGEAWHFIDWQPTLHKTAAEQGTLIFGLRGLMKVTQRLGKDVPKVPTPWGELAVPEAVERLVSAAREHLFNADKAVLVSGPEKQVSWASNAWGVLAGVFSPEEAATAMRNAYNDPDSVIGMTPYLHHYLCEAFVAAGLHDLALKHILEYWGSMVDAGAETFWEAWDPKRPQFSPYDDFHSNSFCHAWSCTPALLLRTMGYE